MIDTTQNLSIAAAHAYLNKKALKRAEREEKLLFWVIFGWGVFVGVIIGTIITQHFRG